MSDSSPKFLDCTFVMIKPDAVARGLVGTIIERFERAGFVIRAMEFKKLDVLIVDAHYAEHVDKPFYRDLLAFTISGHVVTMLLSKDENAIASARALIGPTDPATAPAGTIRGDLKDDSGIVRRNLVHSSDSTAAAGREITLHFFPDIEIEPPTAT
jgi:nucleoside-diphosphate kinase